jgi:hypothetical protein
VQLPAWLHRRAVRHLYRKTLEKSVARAFDFVMNIYIVRSKQKNNDQIFLDIVGIGSSPNPSVLNLPGRGKKD